MHKLIKKLLDVRAEISKRVEIIDASVSILQSERVELTEALNPDWNIGYFFFLNK